MNKCQDHHLISLLQDDEINRKTWEAEGLLLGDDETDINVACADASGRS